MRSSAPARDRSGRAPPGAEKGRSGGAPPRPAPAPRRAVRQGPDRARERRCRTAGSRGPGAGWWRRPSRSTRERRGRCERARRARPGSHPRWPPSAPPRHPTPVGVPPGQGPPRSPRGRATSSRAASTAGMSGDTSCKTPRAGGSRRPNTSASDEGTAAHESVQRTPAAPLTPCAGPGARPARASGRSASLKPGDRRRHHRG